MHNSTSPSDPTIDLGVLLVNISEFHTLNSGKFINANSIQRTGVRNLAIYVFYDESISSDLLNLWERFGTSATVSIVSPCASVNALTSVQLKPARSAPGLFTKFQRPPHIPIA
jgi:hypothetical protein